MIRSDARLYIYEIRGEIGEPSEAPSSYIGLWNEDDFTYLFFTRTEDEFVNRLIGSNASQSFRHEMDYRDWQTGLPAEGLLVGSLQFLAADYLNPPSHAILLDPSVVFGDGNHPTTGSCLSLLEQIITSDHVESMLDLGTGTGILSLAAAKMGLKHILAADKNRLAFRTASENVRLNKFESVIKVVEGEARLFLDRPYELAAANLPFGVLRDLAVRQGADLPTYWVISGINEQQGVVLKDLFFESGYKLIQEHQDHPWVTFALKKQLEL
jgi:ribosomal protein L11 methyltransferase